MKSQKTNEHRILIVGFSGSGKSSLLTEIKKFAPSDWKRFDDLDRLILKNNGRGQKDLAQLIKEAGWEQFRLWERQELERWLMEEGKGILALGGGALSSSLWENYRISPKLRFCYLKTSFETCWARLNGADEIRPLLKRGKEALFKLYVERAKIFEQIEWKFDNEGERDLGLLGLEFWKEINSIEKPE